MTNYDVIQGARVRGVKRATRFTGSTQTQTPCKILGPCPVPAVTMVASQSPGSAMT